jgi:G3E family GTPase
MLLLACRVARVRALQAPQKKFGRLRALASTVAEPGAKVPVTLLSGFLGTGKTTLLRNLLEEASQDKDSKVGVVVNDMAAVNIDAKITARRLDLDETDGPKMQGAAEFVEIGDGCVCCSMADELFTTLAELAAVSSMKGYKYNHIVIEATGIAEPRSIRDQFQDAEAAGMPLMDEVELSTLVTVVDSAAFLDAYAETASIAQRPDLAAPVDDDPSPFLMARFDHSLQRSVVDLLVEQVECADVLLLNKKDLVSEKQMDRLAEIMRALNPTAIVKQCEFGDAALNEVLGVAGDEGAARIGPVDEHKVAVAASKGANCDDPACTDPSHLHAHDAHDHAAKEEHSHASHDHAHAKDDCTDPTCTDPTHDHSHKAHDHASHDHAHKEDAVAAEDCTDPGCTDPTHDHSHKQCINQILAAREAIDATPARWRTLVLANKAAFLPRKEHPTHWLIRAQATRRTTIRTATRTTPSASIRSSTPRAGPSRPRGSRIY